MQDTGNLDGQPLEISSSRQLQHNWAKQRSPVTCASPWMFSTPHAHHLKFFHLGKPFYKSIPFWNPALSFPLHSLCAVVTLTGQQLLAAVQPPAPVLWFGDAYFFCLADITCLTFQPYDPLHSAQDLAELTKGLLEPAELCLMVDSLTPIGGPH